MYWEASEASEKTGLGLIQLRGINVLIFGGQVPMSAQVPSPEPGAIDFVIPQAWPSATHPDDIPAMLAEIPRSAFQPEGIVFDSGDCGLLHFVAEEEPPTFRLSYAEIECPPAQYDVLSIDWDDSHYHVRVYRLLAR
jgi:hypothetical protein